MIARPIAATMGARWMGVATAGSPIVRCFARWVGRSWFERVSRIEREAFVRHNARWTCSDRLGQP